MNESTSGSTSGFTGESPGGTMSEAASGPGRGPVNDLTGRAADERPPADKQLQADGRPDADDQPQVDKQLQTHKQPQAEQQPPGSRTSPQPQGWHWHASLDHQTPQAPTPVPGGGPAPAAPLSPAPVPVAESKPAQVLRRVTGAALGPYQSAVVRIGFSATWLLFLLRELPHRRELYGPDGPWSWNMAQRLVDGNHAFTALLWTDSTLWFETVYVLAVLSSALLLLGWRTRTMSVLFMVGVLSLQNRSVFMGDGGDNVIHLMAMYLVLTRCGQVWSLDARRRARAAARAARTGEPVADRVGPVLWSVVGVCLLAVTLLGDASGGWLLIFWGLWVVQALWWAAGRYAQGDPRALLDVVANLAHNATMVVIMAEVCLIYATAGWYKIQGSRWQDGTALYYPLHLDYFSPWPALSDILGGSGLIVMLLTYGTVAVQVAFPFTLFNRRVKNVLLVAMMLEHAGIALLLGLPFFSLAMIAADAVFLPTGFLRWLGGRAGRLRERLVRRAAPRGRTDEEQRPRTLVA